MSNSRARGYVYQYSVLGNGDIDYGREMAEQLCRWLNAAAEKHYWPAEADGIKAALQVCTAEFRELEEAVVLFHPDEHVVMELLDNAAVIMRILAGEHIRDKEQRKAWQKLVASVRPLPKGQTGPWDIKARNVAETL